MPAHSKTEDSGTSAKGAVLALGVATVVGWINLILTGRWADEPGALHGWRLVPYTALLIAATILTIVRPQRRLPGGSESRVVAAAGCAVLAVAFLTAFPIASWSQIPFYDDWPWRLQLTLNGLDALRHGIVTGWQWAFLGGYHSSADLSQSLSIPAGLLIAAAGPTIGFHLFLAVVVAAIPVMARYDVGATDGPVMGRLACGLSAIVVAGYFATVLQSGMANSAAGAAAVAAALASSHAARRGRWWGGPALLLSLTLTLYSHAAFFGYAGLCLLVESLFYRDIRSFVRLAVASAAAFVAALPLHWELLLYPEWFLTNNLYFEPPTAFDWAGFARQVWYATEMLALPGRWFNDYGGLAGIWLVPIAWMAWRDRTRAGFYAWATLAVVLSLRFNAPQLGLVSSRQLHLLPVVLAPALAGFIARYTPGGLASRAVFVGVIACFVAIPFAPIPHCPDIRAFNPALVDRIAAAGGHLVLIENNPHWDMTRDPDVRSEKSRFDVHFEALLPEETGRLFYGQAHDGYHYSVFRHHALAGGAFRGDLIDRVDYGEFIAEMHRWGVESLFVWTGPSKRYLDASPSFTEVWHDDDWTEFRLADADPRAVVTTAGTGTLSALTPAGGDVYLDDVPAGTPVVVRTHFYPAWSAATTDGREIALRSVDGQIGFDAPGGATAVVRLTYDRRIWLSALALGALVGTALLLAVWPAAGGPASRQERRGRS